MAWSTPKTWVAEDLLTAAELNLQIRDNLLETEAASANDIGSLLVSSGENSVSWRRPVQAETAATVTTTSPTPVGLGGNTPQVTFTTNGACLILFAARMQRTAGVSTADDYVNCGPQINGVTGAEAAIARAVRVTSTPLVRYSGHVLHYDIPPGTYTAQLMYWVTNTTGGLTGSYGHRSICVIPLS